MRQLDYTSRFVRVIPALSPNQSSHNSTGHGGRYNMVVTASTSQQITWTTANVRVYSDSVLCLRKMSDHSEANRRWENQVKEFRQSDSYREVPGIDGEQMEFEWNFFAGLTSLQILQKIQNDLQERNIVPEKVEDRIVVMSMSNSIEWTRKGNGGNCISNSEKVKTHAREILAGTLDFPRPWRRKEVVWKLRQQTGWKCDFIASQMVQRFKETGHRVFTSASALSRGILGMLKGKGTTHFNAIASNTEL